MLTWCSKEVLKVIRCEVVEKLLRTGRSKKNWCLPTRIEIKVALIELPDAIIGLNDKIHGQNTGSSL